MLSEDRLLREKHTIEMMINIFCKSHSADHSLCPNCKLLLEQVHRKIENCKYGMSKPNCSRCDIYCYSEDMRKGVKAVMRYSGLRMLVYHPILSIMHLRDISNKSR